MVVGTYYVAEKTGKGLVVYAIGAPTKPDNGDLPDAKIILSKGFDLFVPDYIGFGRSGGKFSPMNCIETLLRCYEQFRNKYTNIYWVGRSLGGAYIPLLPKYNSEIKNLCLIYPAADQKSQGTVEGEETNDWFVKALRSGEYKRFYKGVAKKIWEDHVNGLDGLSPMNNIQYLCNSRLFIGHGKKDKCINYTKSVNYYQKILDTIPKKANNFKMEIYSNGNHGPSTSNLAINDFLNWIG